MSDTQLAVLPPDSADTLYPRSIGETQSASSVQITLAKRILRKGARQVIHLAAQTAVPLPDDEAHSISDMALSLADGTRVAVSVQLLNQPTPEPAIYLQKSIYDPLRYEVPPKSNPLTTAFVLLAIAATTTVFLHGNEFLRGTNKTVAPAHHSASTTGLHRPQAKLEKKAPHSAATVVEDAPTDNDKATAPAQNRTAEPASQAAKHLRQQSRKPRSVISHRNSPQSLRPERGAPARHQRGSSSVFVIPPPPAFAPSIYQNGIPPIEPQLSTTPSQPALKAHPVNASANVHRQPQSVTKPAAHGAAETIAPPHQRGKRAPLLSTDELRNLMPEPAQPEWNLPSSQSEEVPTPVKATVPTAVNKMKSSAPAPGEQPQLRLEPIAVPGE